MSTNPTPTVDITSEYTPEQINALTKKYCPKCGYDPFVSPVCQGFTKKYITKMADCPFVYEVTP